MLYKPVRSSTSVNFGALHMLQVWRRAQLTLAHLLHCQSSALKRPRDLSAASLPISVPNFFLLELLLLPLDPLPRSRSRSWSRSLSRSRSRSGLSMMLLHSRSRLHLLHCRRRAKFKWRQLQHRHMHNQHTHKPRAKGRRASGWRKNKSNKTTIYCICL